MTREEALEFIVQSIKPDVNMAKVADAIKALEQESRMVVLLEKTYDDFCRCEGGDSWLKIDGKEYTTDVGYAFEGMRIFMEVFKQRLAESEEV